MNMISLQSTKSYRRGSALLAVLWLIAVLAFAVVTAVKLLSFDLDVADSQVNGFRARQAAEMGIASKTLQRWRRDGLCVHWMKESITAPVRVAIYRSSVESFVAKHRTECDRACNFKRYNHAERARILEIGRALVASGVSLNLAAKEAARQVGRSHEGVRLLFLREIFPFK